MRHANQNDIQAHRLSGGAFDVNAYAFISCFDHSTAGIGFDHQDSLAGEAVDPLPGDLVDQVNQGPGDVDHCIHCGSALVRGNVYRHTPSGALVVFGHQCAQRLGFPSTAALQLAQKSRRLYLAGLRQALLGNPELEKIITDLRPLAETEAPAPTCKHEAAAIDWATNTARDILEKLARYHNFASEKQKAFAASLPAKLAERLTHAAERRERDAQEAERLASAPDWTPGRQEIHARVAHIKTVESDWGTSWKCLLILEDGRKAWGTLPNNAEKGDQIRIRATFTPKDGEPHFAFYKRPHALQG